MKKRSTTRARRITSSQRAKNIITAAKRAFRHRDKISLRVNEEPADPKPVEFCAAWEID